MNVDSNGIIRVELPEGGVLILTEARGGLAVRAQAGELVIKPSFDNAVRIHVEGLPYEPPRWRDQ